MNSTKHVLWLFLKEFKIKNHSDTKYLLKKLIYFLQHSQRNYSLYFSWYNQIYKKIIFSDKIIFCKIHFQKEIHFSGNKRNVEIKLGRALEDALLNERST